MNRANGIALLAVGLLYSVAGIADDGESSISSGEPLTAAALSVESMLAESAYPPRWRLYYPAEATVVADDWLRPSDDFQFQDTDFLSRLSGLRGLSLLTLAEIGQSQVFLGVDEEGLVGLHFNLFSRRDRDNYLEMARMPYLEQPSQPEN